MSKKQKKVLITRYGGIGDVAPVMVVAEQLKAMDWHVTIAVRHDGPVKQTDLFNNLNCFDEVLDLVQLGPWGNRCVKYKHGYKTIESTYAKYDWILDYMFIIEGNSTSRSSFIHDAVDKWQQSRNSNWVNWYDLHLAWAHIDPKSVPDRDKRPTFKLNKEETLESTRLRDKYKTIITLNPFASSLARSWYQFKDFIKLATEYWGEYLICVWNPQTNKWDSITHEGPLELDIKIDSPLRRSMVLVHASDLYIGVDTGLNHIAEGLKKKHITLYSTVPAWTRAQYYKYETSIDMGKDNPEYYSFVIQQGDPLRIKEESEKLSKREKKLGALYTQKVPIEQAAKELNTDTYGVNLELEALQKKMDSFSRLQSKALTDVTPEMIFTKMKELLK